ncbi:MAG: hypothetical protein JO033_16620 [Acidobacteriaceae bacterium]|nr:hypothetical protein [Acidobacteriaceae bacterium]MBV9497991.1 hypothetical protein [Acidobacteriaceae bacterium]
MAAPVSIRKKVPIVPSVVCIIVAIGLVAALVYLRKPAPKNEDESGASPEARAYVRNLALSDVGMKAAENFMKQQVVEIDGKITNNGPRPLQSVDVYCLFYGIDGREIYRERVPIVRFQGSPLTSHETRGFRLPFDNLPGSWNQAMPKLVIAHIAFAG